MADSPVQVTKDPAGVAVVILNRPSRLNALSDDLLSGLLRDVFLELGADVDVRSVVVTGAGRAFSAGADLDAAALDAGDDKAEFIRLAQTTVTALLDIRVPTIAAVHGPAVGGGMGLALACDIRIAGPQAFFSSPFMSMALIPDFGASYLLTHAVGPAHALLMAVTGRRVAGQESLRLGLVQELVDDPLARAMELAATIAAGAPRATIATKQAIRSAAAVDAPRQILEIEPVLQAQMMAGREFRDRFETYRAAITSSKGGRDPRHE
jgi:enoyl-CoA hydratase/carnithine racemase